MVMAETMRAAFGRVASDLLDEDPRTAIVLAEISTEHFEDAERRHPKRVINVGIMEQTMVGVAAGLAMEGFHPIAHSLSPFMAERPYEQLKLDIGYQGLGGTFVGTGGSYDYASEGATHHAPADAALMLAIPRMEVVAPGHADEVAQVVRTRYASETPTYIRLSATSNEAAHLADGERLVVLRRGGAATVVAFGPMLDRTVTACEGLDVTIAYATSLRPFDHAGLVDLTGAAPRIVTIEPWYEGTAAPVVLTALAGRPASVTSIGVPRAFIHAYGTSGQLDTDLGLDAGGLRARLEVLLG
jgi:transketolase